MQDFDYYPFLTSQWHTVDLEILENALFEGDASWYYPDMISPFNRIYFIIDGEIYLENAKERHTLSPGHLYLVPASSCYTYGCPEHIRKFYVHFNMTLLPGVDLFGQLGTIQELPFEDALLDTILSEIKKESLSGLLHLKAIFWKIAYDFFLQIADGTHYLDQFQGLYRQKPLLEYISSHLRADLRIPELAQAFHAPERLLSRSFKQDTGLGIKEYIEMLLLQKARHLLLHTNLPICEISETLGFSDPFYFSRFFKKSEQISPREYRKRRW